MSDVILGIDTSSRVCIGLAKAGEVMASVSVGDSRSHAELLAPAVESLMHANGLTWDDLAGVAVGMGPGPFTGLRVGVVAAEMLGLARGIPVYHVCSLDVVGVGWALTSPAGEFIACTDARRKELYWALYDHFGQRVAGPYVSAPEGLPNLPCVGPGTLLYPRAGGGMDSFLALKLGVRVDALASEWPSLEQVPGIVGIDAGLLAAYARELPETGPEPLYLRRADAAQPGAPKSVLAGVDRGER